MIDRKTAEQALKSLTESIDLVRNTYNEDWRHGMPTRAAQLAADKQALDEHADAIEALTAALAQPASLTEAQLASACLSYRHDFGLLDADARSKLMFQAKEWARALGYEVAQPAASPAPYDQTALELCEVCGWKTLIPGDVCLNCEHEKRAASPAPAVPAGMVLVPVMPSSANIPASSQSLFWDILSV